MNIVAPPSIRDGFFRWGFPPWFHFVVGGMEISAAAMLAVPALRTFGLLLSATTMASAVIVVIYQREYTQAFFPSAILLVIVIAALVTP
jgi:uncharacterized membrane protein YphA (DoxX/SURF4 family)